MSSGCLLSVLLVGTWALLATAEEVSYRHAGSARFSASRYSVSPSDPTARLEVMFAIKQNNIDVLKRRLDEISYPNSPLYGQQMTRVEVGNLCSNPDATSNVYSFLESLNGVSGIDTTPYGEYVKATASIAVWEIVFNAKYEYYQSSEQSFHAVREYYLPSTIANDVSTVFNTIQGPVGAVGRFKAKFLSDQSKLPSSVKRATAPGVIFNITDSPLMEITPEVLNELYDIPSNNGGGYGTQAVYESINQSYSVTDLTKFQTIFNLPLEQPIDIDGHVYEGPCINGFGNCGEANLDVQYLMGMSQNVPTTFWYDASGLYGFIFNITSTSDPPFVISVSYLDDEASVDQATADSFDTEAVKLGLLGVSLIMASGDSGVSGQFVPSLPEYCGYNPAWPQTSMYVTAVGATQGYPETVCSSGSHGTITSGGGFSNLYPTAPFQTEQVTSYFTHVAAQPFQNASAPTQSFNASGRGYPDIAAQGAYYAIVLDGNVSFAAGTSAATPVFASMVALVNAQRIRAGKASLGWLNPTLYTYYHQFVNDITVGNNSCMEQLNETVYCCEVGYLAAPGWDPVTGLGTVNFTKFAKVMESLPDAFSPTAVPTPNPTTHHNSQTGKFFGIACAGFLGLVGIYTYVMNMQAINVMLGCGKPPMAAAEGAELTRNTV
jgi:tripeptidyl-peptidase-1